MDLFGDKRQLNSMEAGNIYFNLKKSIAAKALVNGFKQVTKDKDIHNFMDECLHTTSKNINIFLHYFKKKICSLRAYWMLKLQILM